MLVFLSRDPAGGQVAVVDGEPVMKETFDRAWRMFAETRYVSGEDMPSSSTALAKLRAEVMDVVVRRIVLRKEASRLSISVSDERVESALDAIVEEQFAGTRSAYAADLRAKRLELADIKEALRDQIVEQELYRRITARTTVTRTEATAFYDRNQKSFHVGVSREIEFVAFVQQSAAQRFAKAHREDLPFRHPERQTATVEKAKVDRATWRAVSGLRDTAAEGPLRLGDTWFVMRADGPAKAPRQLDFRDVADVLTEKLLADKRARIFEAWVSKAIAKAGVQSD